MRTRDFVRTTILIILCAVTAQAADLSILREQIEKVIPRARGQVGVAIKHVESGAEVLVNREVNAARGNIAGLPVA